MKKETNGGWVSDDGSIRAKVSNDGTNLVVVTPAGSTTLVLPDDPVDVYLPPIPNTMGKLTAFYDVKTLEDYTRQICMHNEPPRTDDVGAMILPLSIQSTPRELKEGSNKVRLQIVIQDASGRPSSVTYGDGKMESVSIRERKSGQFVALLTLFQAPDNINTSFPSVITANNVPVARLSNGAFRLANLPFRKVSADQYQFAGELFAAPPEARVQPPTEEKKNDPELERYRDELRVILGKPNATDGELQSTLDALKQLATTTYHATLAGIPSLPGETPTGKIVALSRLAVESGATSDDMIRGMAITEQLRGVTQWNVQTTGSQINISQINISMSAPTQNLADIFKTPAIANECKLYRGILVMHFDAPNTTAAQRASTEDAFKTASNGARMEFTYRQPAIAVSTPTVSEAEVQLFDDALVRITKQQGKPAGAIDRALLRKTLAELKHVAETQYRDALKSIPNATPTETPTAKIVSLADLAVQTGKTLGEIIDIELAEQAAKARAAATPQDDPEFDQYYQQLIYLAGSTKTEDVHAQHEAIKRGIAKTHLTYAEAIRNSIIALQNGKLSVGLDEQLPVTDLTVGYGEPTTLSMGQPKPGHTWEDVAKVLAQRIQSSILTPEVPFEGTLIIELTDPKLTPQEVAKIQETFGLTIVSTARHFKDPAKHLIVRHRPIKTTIPETPRPVPVDPEVQKYRSVLIQLTDQQGKSEEQINNALLKEKLDTLKALLPRYGQELQLLRSVTLNETSMDALLRFALIAKNKGKELEALLTTSAMEVYELNQGNVAQQINARFEPLVKMPGSIGATKFLATATDNGVEIEVTAAAWTGSTIPQKIVEVLGRVTGIAQYEGKFNITLRGKATKAEQEIAAAAFIRELGKIIPALKDSKAVDARIKFAVFQSDIQSPTPQGVTREALVGLLGAYNLENAVNLAGLGAEAVPHVPVTMNGFSLPWITLKDPGTTGGRAILFQKLTEHIYSVAQQRKIRPGELQVLIVPHRLAANAYASLDKAADILNDRPAGPETCLHTVSTLRPKYVFIKSNDNTRSYLDGTISLFIVPTKAVDLDTGTDQQADIKNAEAVFLALTNRLGLTRAQEVDMGGGRITYTPAPAKELQPGYRPDPVEPKQPVIIDFKKYGFKETPARERRNIALPAGAVSFNVSWKYPTDDISKFPKQIAHQATQAAKLIREQFPNAAGVAVILHPGSLVVQMDPTPPATMASNVKTRLQKAMGGIPVASTVVGFVDNGSYAGMRIEFVVVQRPDDLAQVIKDYQAKNPGQQHK